MTILDKEKHNNDSKPTVDKHPQNTNEHASSVPDAESSSSQVSLTQVESQFRHIMDEFKINSGFNVNTGEQPVDTMIEILSSKGVAVSIAILLSYIRHCINNGSKKEITLKIGFNKPPEIPMNFAVNEELLEDIYPGNIIEIN